MAEIVVVPFGSFAYAETLALRHAVLRNEGDPPFTALEIERERDDVHFALILDGKVQACLALTELGEGRVQMRQVCVGEAMRRRGLGRRIVVAAEAYAREKGLRTMAFYARPEAVPFWREMGYVDAADWFEAFEVPEQMMAKRL